MAQEQMKNMTPEQLANMSNMARGMGGRKAAGSGSRPAEAKLSGRGAKVQKLKEQGTALHRQKK